MKYIASLLIALVIPFGHLRATGNPDLLVRVTGVLETTTGISGSDFSHAKIQVQRLSNATLFSDFSVSPSDYALVFSLNDDAVEFIPLSASSSKPKVVLFSFDLSAAAINGRTRIILGAGPISTTSDATGTVLDSSTGEAFVDLKFTGSFSDPSSLAVTHGTGTVQATGKTPDSPSGAAPLILHLAIGKVFTQGT